jgi:GrpB-like predicted nucleotidyltransferase (UPF0157 family)
MAAKPIIDLQGSVADLEQAASAFQGPLAANGFERLPFEQDHIPAGHSEPSERWSKRMWTRTDPSRDAINLHIGTYTDIKDPVVDLVVVAAEQWALATGWNP